LRFKLQLQAGKSISTNLPQSLQSFPIIPCHTDFRFKEGGGNGYSRIKGLSVVHQFVWISVFDISDDDMG